MSHWATSYIGQPWSKHGQGPETWNCGTFFRHVQQAHFGVETPVVPYADSLMMLVRLFRDHQERGHWQQVTAYREGDGVMMGVMIVSLKGSNVDLMHVLFGPIHLLFLALVALNLVAGFQALGTLMAVGLMLLPAATARLWARGVSGLIALSMGLAFLSLSPAIPWRPMFAPYRADRISTFTAMALFMTQ